MPSPISLQSLSHDALSPIQLVATDVDGTLTQGGKMTAQLLVDLVRLREARIDVILATGRSAGWVSAIAHYFPVAGAIAENGGIFCLSEEGLPAGGHRAFDSDLEDTLADHRQALGEIFAGLKATVPRLQESADNAFRLTDWTFDVADLTESELTLLGDRCRAQGWGFTYSTVQCHISKLNQTKATAIAQVLQQRYPHLSRQSVLTIGDSPNDESLFNAEVFPCSVGVANIRRYLPRLAHRPRYITATEACDGFHEVVNRLLAVCI
ncbi:MAG: HAD family hydrolase [Elainellaceae cyanobacterium]